MPRKRAREARATARLEAGYRPNPEGGVRHTADGPWGLLRRAMGGGALLLLLLCGAPQAEARVVLENPDQPMQLEIGGVLQPRLELTLPSSGSEEEVRAEFRFKRTRLDLRGWVWSEDLSFRIVPEISSSPAIRDAWLDFRVSEALRLRAGRFAVPFHWHRWASSSSQLFAERSRVSNEFGFPSGRDIGLMLHGRNQGLTLGYGLGVFDGTGQRYRKENASLLFSMRLAAALRGQLRSSEASTRPSEDLTINLRVGLQGSMANEVRPWATRGGASESGERADWVTGTVDMQLWVGGLTLVGESYLRHVAPESEEAARYQGAGLGLTAAQLLVPNRLDVALRWGWGQVNLDADATGEWETSAAMNLYHRGHGWKTRLNWSHFVDGDLSLRRGDHVLLLEHHVAF